MIIPVLDIKNGIAVSGKSGKRKTYKPLKTIFHESSNPYKIAKSLRQAGASRIYMADLDSIEKIGSNFEIIEKINKIIPVMLDSGVNNTQMAREALKIADKIIVATETLKDIKDLDGILNTMDKEKIIISVDIKDGEIFGKYAKFDFEIFTQKIIELNPDEIIILDISRVGTEKGVDMKLMKRFKGVGTSVIVGGGIKESDIDILHKLGIKKFLVGSALHNGKLPPEF